VRDKTRAAQREWIRYRDAFARLAAALHPDDATAGPAASALVTEDRIQELRDPISEGH
jgi:uncharacterized protein YecT (DUF1311 family)